MLALCLSLLAFGAEADNYVPPKAEALSPLLYSEIQRLFPEYEYPIAFWSQIEQESCLSKKHKRCWGADSQLITYHKNGVLAEHGIGIGQVTYAANADGRVRVDTFSALRKKYPRELGDLSRQTLVRRPDLQVRALILLVKSDYTVLSDIPDAKERTLFTLSAYNGGRGDLSKARRVCGLTKGCDPDKWFDNVERTSVKSRVAKLYKKSNYEINTEYVRNIAYVRMCAYESLFNKTVENYNRSE